MDLTAFATELAPEFTDTRLEHAGGLLVVPHSPVDLGYLAMELYPEDCDDSNAYEIVGQAAGLQPVITFVWEEDNSSPWTLALEMMDLGDRSYVTLPPDDVVDQAWEAFVAVDHPEAADILDALLFDLLWDNGESYGIELISSLPTRIRGGLVNKETIRAGFHLYLDWDEMRTAGAWAHAAELLPPGLGSNSALVAAASALMTDDTETHRDAFIEAYIEAAYRP
jgi:hypothetical protein